MRKLTTIGAGAVATFSLLVSAILLPIQAKANTTNSVTVVSNYNSGIEGADYTATLDDGTVLGFDWYIYDEQATFCGATTTARNVVVPDTIVCENSKAIVNSTYYYGLDFDAAPNVISLTLPSVMNSIYVQIPEAIEELYLLGTTPPYLRDSNTIPYSTTVYVPQSAFQTYISYCNTYNNGWNPSINVKYVGWEPKSITITVNAPGTFGNEVLKVIDQWSDINELTVIGTLNDEDMKYFSRMLMLEKLDLSQTNITEITGCNGLARLKTVVLPSTVLTVLESAFYGCALLSDINLGNVVEISRDAFHSCSSLAKIDATNLINIGENAFESCSKLAEINIPKVERIDRDGFRYCKSLGSIDLSSCKQLNSRSFQNCEKLSSVILGDDITTISDNCFSECHSLTSIRLPQSLIEIGESAFRYSGLTSIELPEGLQYIDYEAFEDVPLTKVTIPSTVTKIGYNAFNTSSLTAVYCKIVIPISCNGFNNVGSVTLHVPAFSVTAYKLSDSWYHFGNIVAMEGTLNDITISDNFSIVDLNGLSEQPNLTLTVSNNTCGHLTVSTEQSLNLGSYNQYLRPTAFSSWGNERDGDYSTLLPYSSITAQSVNVKMSLYAGYWNFISLPFDVNVTDIKYPEGTLWVIRQYNGANRAALSGDTWQNVTNGQKLKAGEGYILHCSNPDNDNYYSFIEFTFPAADNQNKNGIFAYSDVTTPLATHTSEFAHNSSWNLVGNPYPAYFDATQIEHNGVLTVWNGRGYDAFSPIDDNYILRPYEAFFVQCPEGASSMTFKASGRSHSNTSDTYNAPSYVSAVSNDRQVLNITITDGLYTDRARFVVNEQAKADYEISCDAVKFMSLDNTVPQIYIIEEAAKMAINERPLGDGSVTLGVRIANAGEYTIDLSSTSNIPVKLIDNNTGNSCDLTMSGYTFTADKGTIDNRFVLQIGAQPNGIDAIGADDSTQKCEIYDILGRKLSKPVGGFNIINNQKVIVK